MKKHSSKFRFVLCVKNEGYPASLEVRKIYRVIADPCATKRGLVRVIDDSGEDYLYSQGYFVSIKLLKAAKKSLLVRLASFVSESNPFLPQ